MAQTNNFGGITTEEASKAISETLIKVQDDPAFKCIILPMMKQRIRYADSLKGKLFPYSPVDRLKREILIMKIAFFMCIILGLGLLILNTSLISVT